MKNLILPDEKREKKEKLLKEKDLKKVIIDQTNTDEDDGEIESCLKPLIAICQSLNEKVNKLIEEGCRDVEVEKGNYEDNSITTTMETLDKISRFLKKKSKTNRMTKSIINEMKVNTNFLAIAMVNFIDYTRNSNNTQKEIIQRQKAIAKDYKKIYNDKTSMKVNKETFWQMTMSLASTPGIMATIEPQYEYEKTIQLRRKI